MKLDEIKYGPVKYQFPCHESISYHTKKIFFIFWTTVLWYHQKDTNKITWKSFTCITIHQKFLLPKPWRRHSNLIKKNGGMPWDPWSDNTCQQTRSVLHKNHSKQQNMIYHHLFFYWTPIKSQTQQKQKYQSLSRAFSVHFVKHATINSSTAPILHIKLITYMNIDNWCKFLVAISFDISPKVVGIGTKSKILWFHFDMAKENTSHNST